MHGCMFCGKTEIIYNIFYKHGNTNHTIKDDLVEFFGVNVEPHLLPTDSVCNVCMSILDNVAKLKRRLWPFIICRYRNNGYAEYKPMKLGKMWDTFASLKVDDEDPETLMACRTPTPSSLLTYTYSMPYEPIMESEFAERERYRSLSRNSYSSKFGCSDSSVNSEVAEIFSKKRRRKKRKQPTKRRGAETSLSNQSYISYYSRRSEPIKPSTCLRYDENGRLLNKRTRSVSRAQEDEAKVMAHVEDTIFFCKEKDCTMFYEDIDDLTQHKIEDHNILAMYFCDECHKKYTTKSHLQDHIKIHDVCSFYCFMCGLEIDTQEELQRHLKEHMLYSVPCVYCDKSFLNKKSYEIHVKQQHRGKKKRIRFKSRPILNRIDTCISVDEKNVGIKSKTDRRKNFEVRIVNVQSDVSEDNLDLVIKNIPKNPSNER